MMRKPSFKAVAATFVAAALPFALSGCGKPSQAEQDATIAQLESRGFSDPVYLRQLHGHSLYSVRLDKCQLTMRASSTQPVAWLVEEGNNELWDLVVTGDDKLNAAWLRVHPTGRAFTETPYASSTKYDLTPCLTK